MGKGRVMCTLKTTFTALLLITVSAFAQQSQPVQSTQPAGQPTISISAPAAQPAAPQPTPVQAVAAQAQQVQTAQTTLDQVVDRSVQRELGLMEMLKTRTPIVETYLQNLQWDAQLGPVPKDDRYFLGRVDLSESIDRRSFLNDDSMEKHLLGGFTRLFKVQYQPLGFSWMIFADRSDFDKQHYDFQYVRSEEHTSELQSLTNLVCRLLLEKKKNQTLHYPPQTSRQP